MKQKNIEKDFLIICLDRLTRLKPTNTKYERVFKDLLNKKGIGGEDFNFAQEIFNENLKKYTQTKNDEFWSDFLEKEEKRMFYNQNPSFFPLKLNIQGLLDIIGDDSDIPLNLKFLKILDTKREVDFKKIRKDYSTLYPVEKIILTEGITEEILLEPISKILGLDFKKEGIITLGAGGKRQVARKYYKMIEETRLPIFILLDSDAVEIKDMIEKKLRKKDKLYLIKSGEFEDILPRKIIIKAINSAFRDELQISEDDFDPNLKTVKNLKEIYRVKGFGDFQKAEFANHIKLNLKGEYPAGEIQEIIEEIKTL